MITLLFPQARRATTAGLRPPRAEGGPGIGAPSPCGRAEGGPGERRGQRAWALWALLGSALALATEARAEPARALRLTFVSAQLERVKVMAHEHTAPPLDALACLTQPGLRARVGDCAAALATPAAPGDGPPINAQVRLTAAGLPGRRIETFAVPRSAAPRWDYAVILDAAAVARGRSVDLALVDQHGPHAAEEIVLGGKRVAARELLKPGTRRVKLGAAELTYRVEPVGDPRRYHFLVPVGEAVALARGAGEGGAGQPVYQLVPVAEGEPLTVAVKPQLKTRRRTPAPTGRLAAGKAAVDECLGCSRATLRGAIGEARFPVAAEQVATRGGLLALSVADLPTSAAAPIYEGGLEVELVVGAAAPLAPPVEAEAARAGRGRRGRAEGGAGAEVLERVIDAHDPEIQACVADAPDPTGEVVLLFSIAGDGTPMGVVVERSAPNLQKAGECIRRKALKWRFPASRGVITARYPMKFTAQ